MISNIGEVHPWFYCFEILIKGNFFWRGTFSPSQVTLPQINNSVHESFVKTSTLLSVTASQGGSEVTFPVFYLGIIILTPFLCTTKVTPTMDLRFYLARRRLGFQGGFVMRCCIFRCDNTSVFDCIPKHSLRIHAQHFWCSPFDKYDHVDQKLKITFAANFFSYLSVVFYGHCSYSIFWK